MRLRAKCDYSTAIRDEQMHDEGVFDDYAKIIYNYNMSSNRTMREGFGSADML